MTKIGLAYVKGAVPGFGYSVPHHRGVQGDLIGDLIGNQHASIAIQNIASGGGDGLGVGNFGSGTLGPVGAVDHLGIVQNRAQEKKHDEQQGDQRPAAAGKLTVIQGIRRPPFKFTKWGQASLSKPTRRNMERKIR